MCAGTCDLIETGFGVWAASSAMALSYGGTTRLEIASPRIRRRFPRHELLKVGAPNQSPTSRANARQFTRPNPVPDRGDRNPSLGRNLNGQHVPLFIVHADEMPVTNRQRQRK
jgi:hypothetical protein